MARAATSTIRSWVASLRLTGARLLDFEFMMGIISYFQTSCTRSAATPSSGLARSHFAREFQLERSPIVALNFQCRPELHGQLAHQLHADGLDLQRIQVGRYADPVVFDDQA